MVFTMEDWDRIEERARLEGWRAASEWLLDRSLPLATDMQAHIEERGGAASDGLCPRCRLRGEFQGSWRRIPLTSEPENATERKAQ